MEHGATGGWFVSAAQASWGVAIWFAIVLLHGLRRSRGAAPQDPIRSSGPID